MHTFRSIFRFQAREFLDKQNVIALVLLLALALLLTQYGVYKFNQSLTQKKVFQQVEEKKFEQIPNFRMFGVIGFRVILLPAPISILHINSSVISDMTSLIDSAERLNIYKSLKGKNTFSLEKNWFSDFSGIILLLGSLLFLFYGFDFLSNKEYLKFLSTISSEKKAYTCVFLSRSILIFLVLLFIQGCALLLIALNGITVPLDKYLLASFLTLFLTSLFFFVLGSVFGPNKSKRSGIIYFLSLWLVFMFFLPTLLSIFIEKKAESITPVYKQEIDKLKIVMDFEKKVLEEIGVFKMGDKVSEARRGLIQDYWKNDFKKIQALEEKMIVQMMETVLLRQRLSSFFPTTFYLSVNNEISSRGYEILVEFYNLVLKIKRDFFEWIMNKVYFSNYSKVEPYLKGEEIAHQAQPRLPGCFPLGILSTILWISGLLMISYYRFKKSLFSLPKKEKKPIEEKIMELKPGEFKSWKIIGNLLNDQLYNLLSGQSKELKKKKYNLKVFINSFQLNTAKKKQNFFYLCHPSDLPGHTRVCAFLELVMDLLIVPKEKRNEIIEKYHLKDFLKKRFSQLDIDETGQVFLALLDITPFDIYLINDITRAMFMDFAVKLDERIDQLCNDGALVLFLTTDAAITEKKSKEGKYFYDYYSWRQKVRTWRDANKNDE